MSSSSYVLVTTEYRGVFAGELKDQKEREIVLTNARCAIYWGTKTGFLELASKGPNSKSRIGSVAGEIKLYGVTSVTTCTPEAEKAWRDS